jgi:hypothetical protein
MLSWFEDRKARGEPRPLYDGLQIRNRFTEVVVFAEASNQVK